MRDGLPFSWQHYRIGMRALRQREAQQLLSEATAAAIPNIDRAHAEPALTQLRRAAGYE